jgi:hypothetical protein
MADQEKEVADAFAALQQAVGGLLVDFQFMEDWLRTYLEIAYQVADFALAPRVHFRQRKLPDTLGRLADAYALHTPNEVLAKKITALVSERNKLAHRVFVVSAESNVQLLEHCATTLKALEALEPRVVAAMEELWLDLEALMKVHQTQMDDADEAVTKDVLGMIARVRERLSFRKDVDKSS